MQNADSLEKYVERVLPYLDFNELVDVPDWVMDEHLGRGIIRKDLEFMQHEAWNNCYDLCIEVSSYMYGGGLAMEIYDRSEGDKWFENRTIDFAKLCGYKGDESLSSAISFLEKKYPT